MGRRTRGECRAVRAGSPAAPIRFAAFVMASTVLGLAALPLVEGARRRGRATTGLLENGPDMAQIPPDARSARRSRGTPQYSRPLTSRGGTAAGRGGAGSSTSRSASRDVKPNTASEMARPREEPSTARSTMNERPEPTACRPRTGTRGIPKRGRQARLGEDHRSEPDGREDDDGRPSRSQDGNGDDAEMTRADGAPPRRRILMVERARPC